MTYRQLDAAHIIATLERLCHRIEERFPGAGLAGVGKELVSLARDCAREAESLGRPNWAVRAGVAAAFAIMVALVLIATGGAIQLLRIQPEPVGLTELVQGTESAINDVVFLGIAIYFLASVEGRIKRRAVLDRMHQLRSIAHIVDMHQLTKDPDGLGDSIETESSPAETMSRAQLARYLDYCTEMLSLTGKIAALFVERFNDSDVLHAVNEIEDLTTGLSGKIWQKITILERV